MTKKTKTPCSACGHCDKQMTYSEAKRVARKLHLKTHQGYSVMKIAGKLPKELPERPQVHYAKQWKGWNDFLGVK